MNVNPDSPSGQPADPEVPGTPSAAEAATPVRRKRAAKAVATEEGAAPLSGLPAPDTAPAADVAAAPVRKRRAPAAKQEAQVDAPGEGSSAPQAPALTVAAPASQAPASEEEAQPRFDGGAPGAASAAPVGPVGTAEVAEPGEEGAGSAVAGPDQAEGEGLERGRRRGRNRRRGGREDGAPERSEGSAEAEGGHRPQSQAADADLDDDDEPPVKLDPLAVQAQVGEVFSELVSGAFDVDAEAEAADPAEAGETAAAPSGPPKRVLLAEPDAPKLQKVLAQSGVGSRRDMEQMIVDGLITVNGQPAHVGQRISFGDQIKVDGRLIKVRIVPPPPRIIAYHKPVGEVVTHDDPQHRPTVFRRLPRLPQGKWQSVGRLDINTEGLLLFTNSGELANKLMHPRFGVEREYAVRVLGTLEPDAKAQLLEGVEIEGQKASFRSIENGGGEGVNHWYRVVITEGRNREVRKLFDAVGLTVSRLIRIRYGTVVLPRGLKRGVWVDLEGTDVRLICQLAGHVQQPRHGNNHNERGAAPKGKGANRPPDRRDDRRPERGPDRGPGARPEFNGPRDGRGPVRGKPPEARRDGPPQQAPARAENRTPREEGWEDDFDPARIPNPLEQTFDKRFVQNPRSPAGGRGFRTGGGGFGAGGSAPDAPPPRKAGAPREPDPLQTSVGYIGGDAFHRKGGRGGGGGGGGNRGGGFGGGGGYGGNSGGGQGGRGGRGGNGPAGGGGGGGGGGRRGR